MALSKFDLIFLFIIGLLVGKANRFDVFINVISKLVDKLCIYLLLILFCSDSKSFIVDFFKIRNWLEKEEIIHNYLAIIIYKIFTM